MNYLSCYYQHCFQSSFFKEINLDGFHCLAALFFQDNLAIYSFLIKIGECNEIRCIEFYFYCTYAKLLFDFRNEGHDKSPDLMNFFLGYSLPVLYFSAIAVCVRRLAQRPEKLPE